MSMIGGRKAFMLHPKPAGAPLLLTYKGIDQAGSGTTQNFTSKAIKDTYGARHVIVGVAHENGSVNVSSLSVDGVAATMLVDGLAGNTVNAEIWIAELTSANGATGTISVTFSASAGSCDIAWAVIEGLSSTTPIGEAEPNGSGAGALTLDVNTQNPSVIFGVTINSINTDEATSWTGTDADTEIQNSTQLHKFSVAYGNLTSAETPRSITADSTSWNLKRGRLVSLA